MHAKRILLFIGALLVPLGVHAQALSPWVQEALDRADAAIGTATGLPASSVCDNTTVIAAIQANLTLVRKAQTTLIKLEAESESLRTRTTCYEFDRQLLQQKMKQVLDAMDSAVAACKLGTTSSLRGVYQFLTDVYTSFLFGGANPAYKDDRLRYRYPFEDSTLNEPVYDSGSTVPICAYTTDYSPHTLAYIPTAPGTPAVIGTASFDVKSFGCDQDVLSAISPPLDQEAQPMKTFMSDTDTFARNLYDVVSLALFNMNQFLAQLNGGTVTQLPGSQPPAPHEKVSGCLKPFIPDPGTADPQEWEDLILAYPEYFDPDKGTKDYSTGIIRFGPEPGEVLPSGLLLQPLVDFFHSISAGFILSRSYIDRRTDAGLSRPLPVAFVNQIFDSYVSVMNRMVDSNESLQYIDANIEQEMAYYDAISRDSIDGMAEAAKPLKAAVDSMVEVVTEFLPKEYIPSLTFFLARSCVDGHCPQTLDSVAKRIYNPYCHPYVSGDYLEDDTQKRCFCDPSIQSSWGEYDKYCNPDYSSEMSRYNSLPPDFIPGCTEEISGASSSVP